MGCQLSYYKLLPVSNDTGNEICYITGYVCDYLCMDSLNDTNSLTNKTGQTCQNNMNQSLIVSPMSSVGFAEHEPIVKGLWDAIYNMKNQNVKKN